MNNLSEIAQDEVEKYFDSLGKSGERIKEEIRKFFVEIDKEIQDLVAGGDPKAVDFLRGRLAGRLTRVSLKEMQEHKDTVVGIVSAVAKTAILLL